MSKPRGKRAVRANHPRNAQQPRSFERVREREIHLGDWTLPGDFSPLREQPATPRRSS